MKTFLSVILNLVLFILIWVSTSALTLYVDVGGWLAPDIKEPLKVITAWYICPGIGSYLSLKITAHLIKEVNLTSLTSSFITCITIGFIALMVFSILTYRTELGGSFSEMIGLAFQFASILAGVFISKFFLIANKITFTT